jgi:hypothetical protein
MRYFLLGFQQLPMVADLVVTFVVPLIAAIVASLAMAKSFRG